MKRFIVSLSAAALLAGMVAMPALAAAFPAVSQPVCESYGGTFSGGGNFKQCTVVVTHDTTHQTVGFGHGWRSGKTWTVATTTTTVYTLHRGTQSTTTSSTTTCWNPGGHKVPNWIPPCQF